MVMPLKAADPALAEVMTSEVTQALRDLQVFSVLDPQAIGGMLSMEALKQSAGCSEVSCFSELASALGASFVVTGSIANVDGGLAGHLSLVDQRKASVVDSSMVRVGAARELAAAVKRGAQVLVQKLLVRRVGMLRVLASEAGAEVSLDGVTVGVTPLPPQRLSMGPHALVLQKTGFVAERRDVFIRPGDTLVQRLDLVASPEFAQAHRRKNLALRGGALAGAGVAASALAGLGAAYASWMVLFLRSYSGGTQAGLRLLVDFNPAAAAPQKAEGLADPRLSYALNGLAVAMFLLPPLVLAGGATAGVLWFLSEDPWKYRVYQG
jgi:hypothetical protein